MSTYLFIYLSTGIFSVFSEFDTCTNVLLLYLALIILVLCKWKFLLELYFHLMWVDSGDIGEEKDILLDFRVRGLPIPPEVHCYCSIFSSQDLWAHCFNLWTVLNRKREGDQQSSCHKCSVSIHCSNHYPSTLYSLNLFEIEASLKLLLFL